MELSDSQAAAFDDRGYLFFPGLLSADEAAPLQAAIPEILARQGARDRAREGGPHRRPPRLRRPHLLGAVPAPVPAAAAAEPGCANCCGTRCTCTRAASTPSRGSAQGPPGPGTRITRPGTASTACRSRAASWPSVFVDDCTVAKSPLLILPGSHRRGPARLQAARRLRRQGVRASPTSAARSSSDLAEEHGIEPLTGPAGSVCFVHCNIIHGSADNVSPWRRAIAYLIYNAVSNACTGSRTGLVPQQPRLHAAAGGLRRRPAQAVSACAGNSA